MTPILFEKGTRSFTGGGICRLAEATAWSVKEVLNAEYELEMSYPAAGEHFAEIKTERIIYAKPNPTDKPQAFIIYAVSKPLRGKVQIYAEHVSYRQNKITVSPFSAKNIKEALTAVDNAVVGENPFTFTTQMEVINDINSNIPRTLRNSIYGRIISLYGGEIKYDNYAAEILTRRGSNKGFTVRYGKNLLDFNQEEDVSAVYDAVYPYYFVQDLEDEEDFTYVELPEKIIKIGTTQEKVMPLNLTTEFQEEPDVDELQEAAQKYLEQNDINKGVLSVTLDFAILSETEEYKSSIPPERVELGDDVAVIIPTRGVTVRSRIVKTIYDGKKGRFSSVTVGEIETDIADTMVSMANATANIEARTVAGEKAIAKVIAETTETGAKVGLLVETTADGKNAVRGGVLVEAINGQTAAKISADVLDIEGKTLNIKVDATNIEGLLTAKQINADGLTVKNGTIDKCTINENCTILGTLAGNSISTIQGESGVTGEIIFNEVLSTGTVFYKMEIRGDLLVAGMQLGVSANEPKITLYTEYSTIEILDDIKINTMGNVYINGRSVATSADIGNLSDRIEALGG